MSGPKQSIVGLPRLTREQASKHVSYCPETGLIRWKHQRKGGRAAGEIAGGITPWEYWSVMIEYRPYRAHRLAWLLYYGKWPDGVIDHINGDRLDNRIANLRDVDQAQNNANRKPRRENGSKGVSLICGKWVARITVRGKLTQLGRFESEQEAAAAYERAAIAAWGDCYRSADLEKVA